MHDPDALYRQRCRHEDSDERVRRLAQFNRDHAVWYARQQALAARDRPWLRAARAALGTVLLVTAGVVGVLVWSISRFLDGESLGVVDTLAAKVTIPGLFTALGVARMAWAWHRRRAATAVVRAADATASMLPTVR